MPCVAQEAQVPAAALVVPSLVADAEPEAAQSTKGQPKAKAAPKLRLLTQTQVLSKQLARARTLDRAAAAMQGNAKQKRQQAKTWVPPTAKTRQPQAQLGRGSVNKWQPPKGKKPDAKAMPPSFAPPKPPPGRPQPPPLPRQPGDQEQVLWHVDLRGAADQNTVLRQALFQLKGPKQPNS